MKIILTVISLIILFNKPLYFLVFFILFIIEYFYFIYYLFLLLNQKTFQRCRLYLYESIFAILMHLKKYTPL